LTVADTRDTEKRCMKRLHRADLWSWSRFDEARNMDFHSVLWVRAQGNVVIDPLPLSPHDSEHLVALGGAALIVLTNSDHVRDAAGLAERAGAKLAGPAAERDRFPIGCDIWLADGDEPLPGLSVLALSGSKTPGELALVIEGTTLVTGDLVRAERGGALSLLPAAKLSNVDEAYASVQRLAALPELTAVLVGDGWPVFRDAKRVLAELLASRGA
jgi:glyoxylase-like metal-dependent hydrolase (beta-lactamase superfamily II)